MGVLRPLIAEASDPKTVVLAVKAVNDYLSDPQFQTRSAKQEAIVFLKRALDQTKAKGAQLMWISELHEYLDLQTRKLAASP